MFYLILNLILNVGIFFIFIKFFSIYIKKIQTHEHAYQQKYLQKRDRFNKLKQKNNKVEEENHRLSQLSSSTANLYEISKDLGSSLKFHEKAPLLINKIWNILHSHSIKLILVAQENSTSHLKIKNVLSLSYDEKHLKEEDIYIPITEKEQNICDLMAKNNMTEMIVFNTKTSFLTLELNLPSSTTSFMALPLKIKDETMAIMAIENINPENIEKARVIASQLALDLQKNQLYEKVERLSITDSLTQVFLRRHFMTRFQEEITRSKKNSLHLSCIMIDIDHFKSYNDSHGHIVGDFILQELSLIIKNNVREMDLICRYGGEEFCIFLPETVLEETRQIAERLREDVEQYDFNTQDKHLSVTISLGISTYPEQRQTVQGLIDLADQCLYKAKNAGRNRIGYLTS